MIFSRNNHFFERIWIADTWDIAYFLSFAKRKKSMNVSFTSIWWNSFVNPFLITRPLCIAIFILSSELPEILHRDSHLFFQKCHGAFFWTLKNIGKLWSNCFCLKMGTLLRVFSEGPSFSSSYKMCIKKAESHSISERLSSIFDLQIVIAFIEWVKILFVSICSSITSILL